MDSENIRLKITAFIKKYKYAAIILLVGLVLMLMPSNSKNQTTQQATLELVQENTTISEELAQILSQIAGAGDVRVLLTEASGKETVYQTSNKISQSEENSTTQIDTVTVTDADRNETGLVKQTNPPVYQGAIVVCQGADSAAVRLAIVDAVSKVTGLSSDRISVLKMK